MRALTPRGLQIVQELAAKHGFSPDAASHMLFAVLNGNGSMAQFNHPEFGGSGQWMKGGMIMLGDMFNNFLKGRVDGLCWDICGILEREPGLLRQGSFQSQNQSGGGQQAQASGAPSGQSALFIPDPEESWWPSELGAPNATGQQNSTRYAYFANARRLAVKTGSEVWVYDTQDHRIGGFSQQQGGGGSITFSSQYGPVALNTLPVVSRNGQAVTAPTPAPPPPAPAGPMADPQPAPSAPAAPTTGGQVSASETLAAIEKLGEFRDKGILTEDEFAKKKAELLSRL